MIHPNRHRLLLSPLWFLIVLLTLIDAGAPSAAASAGPETRVRATPTAETIEVGTETTETPATIGQLRQDSTVSTSATGVATNTVDDIIGAACSFSGDTRVLMADGTTEPISEVDVGDEVLAYDPETGERGAREVTHLWVHQDTLVDLDIDGHSVTTTEDHPFWNASDAEWQRADRLDGGDYVLSADGDLLPVDGINKASTHTGTAYNLTVNDIHTYYVAVGNDQVLVHNQCGPSIGSRMQAAGPGDEFGLPGQGRIRYVPPHHYNPASPLPRGLQGGYIDRFGNEWVVGSSRTPGHPFEWDVQLSPTGRAQIGWLSRDGSHVNVSPLGEVTHR